MRELTMEEKIGQMVMVGFDGFTPDRKIRELIRDYYVGGVILFSRNIESAKQLKQLTGLLQGIVREAGLQIPLFIALDQEGGTVNRVTDGVALSPGNMALGASFSPHDVEQVGCIMGRELAALGINMNLAPVLDLATNPKSHLGTRCFGENPNEVAKLGRAFIEGLQGEGVVAVGKHFVGYGTQVVDPHCTLPINNESKRELENRELIPFKAAVKASVDGIMSAHIVVEGYDKAPVTLSKPVLTGILRDKLAYTGLILTDCLEMGAIQENYQTGDAAVQAIEAGADLVLVSHSYDRQKEAIRSLLDAVQKGRLSKDRIDESVERIWGVKQNLHRLEGKRLVYNIQADLQQLQDPVNKGVTLLKNEILPIPKDWGLLVIAPSLSGRQLSPVEQPISKDVSIKTELSNYGYRVEEVFYKETMIDTTSYLRKARGTEVVVLLVLDPSDNAALANLIKEFYRIKGKHFVLVGLGDPRLLKEYLKPATIVFTYSTQECSLNALAKLLAGKITPQGRLPIQLSEDYPVGYGVTFQ